MIISIHMITHILMMAQNTVIPTGMITHTNMSTTTHTARQKKGIVMMVNIRRMIMTIQIMKKKLMITTISF